jgi:hypothetical protein
MSANKLFGKDIIITSTTNASGTSIGSISTLGGVNINQTALISGALTSIANSNTIGNLFTTGGNVGLGTTSPVQRLDVNGNLNFTGNLYQNGSVYSGSTQWGSTGANIYFNTGNVGIGTIFPSTKLHLKDAGSVTLLLEADHDNVNESDVATIQLRQDGGLTGMDIGIDNTNSSYIKFNTGTTKGNDFTIYDDNTARMFINSSGNMGIGTTSPNSVLELSSSVQNKARLILSGQEFYQASNTSTSGIALLSGVNRNNNRQLWVADGANLTQNTTNPVIRIIPLTSSSGSIATIDAISTDGLTRQSLNLGNNMNLHSSGNVGIGTTSPAYTLDVNGSSNTIQATGINNTLYVPNCVFSNNSTVGGAAVSSFLTPNMPVNSGNTCVYVGRSLSVGNSTSITYNYAGSNNTANSISLNHYGLAGGVYFLNNGNVGINTNNPAYTLDVNGSLRSTGDIFVGNGIGAEALNLWDIPGAAWQLATGDHKLNIRNGTVGSTMVDRVTIASTGNVGIGTITPIGKISVDYSGISANQNVLSLHTSNTGTNDYNLIEAGHGASTTFVLKGNGNVGIGTTSPSQRLHVNGNGFFNNSIGVNGGHSWFWITASSTPNYVSIGGSGATPPTSGPININNSGNIGIGTTSPTSRLHLANPSTQNTNNMVFEVGTTADGLNAGWSAINWNGYFNGGETRINTGKNRWRLFVDQRSAIDNLVFDTYNGTTLTTIMTLTTNGNVSFNGVVSTTGLTNIPSFCYINGTGTISNPNSLLFNGSVHIDNKSGFNATTGKYTVPMTGFYSVSFNVRLNDSTASGAVVVATTRSATTTYTVDVWIPLDPANRRCANYTRLMSLISGDIIFITMSPNNSGPGSISVSEMSVHLVSIA